MAPVLSPAGLPPGVKVKLKEVDRFHGDTKGMHWRNYHRLLEDAAKWNSWTYTQRGHQLSMAMRGLKGYGRGPRREKEDQGANVDCFLCGQRGHIARRDPQRAKGDTPKTEAKGDAASDSKRKVFKLNLARSGTDDLAECTERLAREEDPAINPQVDNKKICEDCIRPGSVDSQTAPTASMGLPVNPPEKSMDNTNERDSCQRDATVKALQVKPGWYLSSQVNGIPIEFLVDTGSSITVIDVATYQQFEEDVQETLKPPGTSLVCADGTSRQQPREAMVSKWIWLWYPPKAKAKLSTDCDGPYLVVKELSDATLQIQKSRAHRVRMAHRSDCRPCELDSPVNWLSEGTMDEVAPTLRDMALGGSAKEGADEEWTNGHAKMWGL